MKFKNTNLISDSTDILHTSAKQGYDGKGLFKHAGTYCFGAKRIIHQKLIETVGNYKIPDIEIQ